MLLGNGYVGCLGGCTMSTWLDRTAIRYLRMVGVAVSLHVSWMVLLFVLVLGCQTFLRSLLGGPVLLVEIRLGVLVHYLFVYFRFHHFSMSRIDWVQSRLALIFHSVVCRMGTCFLESCYSWNHYILWLVL